MFKHSGGGFKVLVAGVLATFCVQTVFGNAFRNPPSSASALALDGAKSAMIDDVSAVSVNPANLTAIDKPTASISATFIKADASFTSPLGIDADTRNTLKILPNIAAAVPLKGGVVFGLGITTPFGQSVEWAKESTLPYFSEMILVDIAPTLAFKLSDSLSAGAGVDLYESQLHLKQLMPWSVATGNPATPAGTVDLKGDGMAAGASVGLSWDVTAKQRLAFVYHSPFDIDYEGDTKLTGIPATLAPFVQAATDFETTIKFPTVVSAGYALNISDTVTIGADVEWVEFSRFESMPLDVGANSSLGLFPSSVPQNWDDIWTYGVAGSWQCAESLELRGSYRFLESPIPDTTLAPTLPDADKHTIGIGLGWQGNGQSIDLGYTYSIIDDRNVTANVNPMFIGSYELDSHIVSVSYTRSL